MKELKCKCCGAPLVKIKDDVKCEYCGTIYNLPKNINKSTSSRMVRTHYEKDKVYDLIVKKGKISREELHRKTGLHAQKLVALCHILVKDEKIEIIKDRNISYYQVCGYKEPIKKNKLFSLWG